MPSFFRLVHIVGSGQIFNLGILCPGVIFSFTFDDLGKIQYYGTICSFDATGAQGFGNALDGSILTG